MNLSPWTDIPFKDDDAFLDFQMAHALAHIKIAQVMYGLGSTYSVYPLMETPKSDADWKLNHQSEHESIYFDLGLTGVPDLSTVDFNDEGEFNDWMLLHQQVHQFINSTLNIT